MSFLIISLCLIGLDQWSKYVAVQQLFQAPPYSVLGNVLRFTYVENRGAAFGILQNQMWLFFIITLIVIVVLVRLLWKRMVTHPLTKIGVAMVIAGAIGNVIDRIFRGFVVDFIQVDLVQWFHFPIFNVADICVTVGVVLMILGILLFEEETS